MEDVSVRQYRIPTLARLLHRLPHIDLTFKRADSTFDLQNDKYKESLMFWAAVPVLWLLVTLLVFLVYFCLRCWLRRGDEKRRKSPCLRLCMAGLILLTCGTIGVGFYGNEDVNKGVGRLMASADDALYTFNRVRLQTMRLQTSINQTMSAGISRLNDVYRAHPELSVGIRQDIRDHTDRALRHARDILHDVTAINRRAHGVELDRLGVYSRQNETFRWRVLLPIFGWLMFLCLLLLAGVGASSKCVLLIYCAFGIFTLVVCWSLTGLHLAIGVGIGDFCMTPHSFFLQLFSAYVATEQDALNYYIYCDGKYQNPFKHGLQGASDNVKEANMSLNKALSIAYKFIPSSEIYPGVQSVHEGLGEAGEIVMLLMALLDCTNLHKNYVDMLDSICHMALPGVVYILVSSGITGLFLSALILLSSKAWRTFGTSDYMTEEEDASDTNIRNRLLSSDDDDVFYPNDVVSSNLNRAACFEASEQSEPCLLQYSENSSSASILYPTRYSCSRGPPQGVQREGVKGVTVTAAVNRRTTPPPAYNSNEFYRQYSDVNPPDDSRTEYHHESSA